VSHDQRALRCLWQLGNRPLSPFSYMRLPSCRTQRSGRTPYGLHSIKNRNTQRVHMKNNPRIDSILCVRCVFRRFSCAYIACVASVALRMTAWKPTFKSVFCILMAVALFQRSARVRQPAIAKFLFHDG